MFIISSHIEKSLIFLPSSFSEKKSMKDGEAGEAEGATAAAENAEERKSQMEGEEDDEPVQPKTVCHFVLFFILLKCLIYYMLKCQFFF